MPDKRLLSAVIGVFVVFDALVTYFGPRESNPVWRPLVESYGREVLFLLALPALVLLFAMVKFAGWITMKVEKYPKGEQVALNTITVAWMPLPLTPTKGHSFV